MTVHMINSPRLTPPAGSAPTVVSYTESSIAWGAGDGVNSNRVISSVAVQTGDFITVICGTEDTSISITAVSDTSTNTYTSRHNNATANNCGARCWTAVANATTTITITCTIGSNSGYAGAFAVICRGGGYGVSAAETNTTEAPSLAITTTKANSVMIFAQFDWNASDGTSRTFRTVNVAATERAYFRNSAHYSVFVCTYSDTGAAGAKTPGLSAPSSQKTSMIAVEVASP